MKRTLFVFLFISGFNCYSQSDSTLTKFRYNNQLNYYYYDTIQCKLYYPDSIIKIARKYIGVPYLAEGKTETGFDCTGFLFFIHKPFCVYLPYFSFQFSEIGLKISSKEAKKGDLILFNGHDLNEDRTGHVGLVISNAGEPLRFIHASTSKGVREDKLVGNKYFEPRFREIRRVVY